MGSECAAPRQLDVPWEGHSATPGRTPRQLPRPAAVGTQQARPCSGWDAQYTWTREERGQVASTHTHPPLVHTHSCTHVLTLHSRAHSHLHTRAHTHAHSHLHTSFRELVPVTHTRPAVAAGHTGLWGMTPRAVLGTREARAGSLGCPCHAPWPAWLRAPAPDEATSQPGRTCT